MSRLQHGVRGWRHGYKWSPANKVWQRQITPNAAYSTKKLLEELEQIFTENEK
jgi:hypothetical protein